MDWLTNLFMNGTAPFMGADNTGAMIGSPGGPLGFGGGAIPSPVSSTPVPGSMPTPPAGGYAGPGGPSIGESLQPQSEDNVPLPRPRPVPQASPTAQASAAPANPAANPMDRIAQVLRGVQAPPRPDVVKPSTPHGPPVQHIQGGNIAQLLQHLYPQLAQRLPIPSLGGALGIGRY